MDASEEGTVTEAGSEADELVDVPPALVDDETVADVAAVVVVEEKVTFAAVTAAGADVTVPAKEVGKDKPDMAAAVAAEETEVLAASTVVDACGLVVKDVVDVVAAGAAVVPTAGEACGQRAPCTTLKEAASPSTVKVLAGRLI